MPRTIAIVIPIHNGRDLTLRCLRSLEDLRPTPALVIVIDDGSEDGSADAIIQRYPDVVVLRGDGHLWWSGAMNLGARFAIDAGAEAYWSLNNDCVVAQNSLAELARVFDECGGRALVCPQVRRWPDGEVLISCGGRLNWWWRGPRLIGAESTTDHAAAPFEVDWIPGMGVLVPSACFNELHGYDSSRFPQYRGDIDFSLRAKKRGFRLICEMSSVIWNDPAQKGLAWPDRPTFRDLGRQFTHRKSVPNLRETVPFALRHAPWPAVVPFFGSYYGTLLASFGWRNVRDRWRRIRHRIRAAN